MLPKASSNMLWHVTEVSDILAMVLPPTSTCHMNCSSNYPKNASHFYPACDDSHSPEPLHISRWSGLPDFFRALVKSLRRSNLSRQVWASYTSKLGNQSDQSHLQRKTNRRTAFVLRLLASPGHPSFFFSVVAQGLSESVALNEKTWRKPENETKFEIQQSQQLKRHSRHINVRESFKQTSIPDYERVAKPPQPLGFRCPAQIFGKADGTWQWHQSRSPQPCQ